MHVVLVHPEIAGNTGNIIRLCANTGAMLHLVEPLGFSMDSALLKRAGLDYHDLADVRVHPSLDEALVSAGPGDRFAFSSRGTTALSEASIPSDAVLLFGAESDGLTESELTRVPNNHVLRIPMRPGNRSLNLANSVAVVVFEAWRQQGYPGAARVGDPAPGHGTNAEHLGGPPFDP